MQDLQGGMLSMQIAEQSPLYVLCQTLLLLNLYEKAVSLNKCTVACFLPLNVELSQTYDTDINTVYLFYVTLM